jgi:hypothetical protein
MLERFSYIALTRDISGTILVAGDSGTILDIYKDGEAYEVEFVAADGDTIGPLTLKAEDVIPIDPDARTARPVANTTIPHVTLTTA